MLENLRTEEVPRLRLGVGLAEGEAGSPDLAAWVLAPFLPVEREAVEGLLARAAEAAEAWLAEGAEATMNRFNARRVCAARAQTHRMTDSPASWPAAAHRACWCRQRFLSVPPRWSGTVQAKGRLHADV